MLDRAVEAVCPDVYAGSGRSLWKRPPTSPARHSYQNLKAVLQLKLQQRRTREELASQGIMPPLKSPAAFHEQRRSLERARTEDYLKRKIRSRPERAELVRMHILEETSAEPSLQATQMKLKRARLADDLNEKLAQRPGPLELVEKNILPVDSSVKDAIIDSKAPYSALDSSSFDEDSSDALSPEQPGSQESFGSMPSPTEAKVSDQLQHIPLSPTQYLLSLPVGTELSKLVPVADQPMTRIHNGIISSTTKPLPALIKQSQPKAIRDKHQRSKKLKEAKPRVKKLKYHQYIPPDQKQEKALLPMDSAYSKLLQQQQLFLQLQILSQQQQHYNYHTILPAPPKLNSDHPVSSSPVLVRTVSGSSCSSVPGSIARQNSLTPSGKPPTSLPPNLDDLKVAELKQELKLRGLPVSGTKTDLIERLRCYQEQSGGGGGIGGPTAPPGGGRHATAPCKPGEIAVTLPAGGGRPSERASPTSTVNPAAKPSAPTPPASPAPSEQSVVSMEEGTEPEAMVVAPTTGLHLPSPPASATVPTAGVLVKDEGVRLNGLRGPGGEPEGPNKDRMLEEKDRQIQELTRMLRQKQQLVEALRLQLEQEKGGQQEAGGNHHMVNSAITTAIKQESQLCSCPFSGSGSGSGSGQPPSSPLRRVTSPGPGPATPKAVTVKQEAAPGDNQATAPATVFLSSHPLPLELQPNQPPPSPASPPPALPTALLTAATHILLTMTPQNTSTKAPQTLQHSTADTHSTQQQPQQLQSRLLNQPVKQTQKSPLQLVTSLPTPAFYASAPPNMQPFFMNDITNGSLKALASHSPALKILSQPSSPTQQPAPTISPKTKEPPCYEEALKQQSHCLPQAKQQESSRSQQMDDLFDILIQSGEILPHSKDLSCSLTPSSPPPHSSPSPQPSPASPRPSPVKEQSPGLASALSLEPLGDGARAGRLEDFLESTAGGPLLSAGQDQDGSGPLSLIDDLHSQMLSSSSILEHQPSPMDTSDLTFASDGGGLTLDLADTNLDNMEWLDLTIGGPSGGLAPLSSTHSVFSTDFLDSHDLQLHWD